MQKRFVVSVTIDGHEVVRRAAYGESAFIVARSDIFTNEESDRILAAVSDRTVIVSIQEAALS
jgi:hypothetical protein